MNLIYSANTISHIPNLKETFKAISNCLADNGVFVFEDPYIGSVLKHNSYDQFYDEHVHLFSLISISNIVKEQDLKIIDVELLKTHGGSIRFHVAKKYSKFKPTINVKNVYKSEIKSVSMKPGETQLTVIFLLATSLDKDLTNATCPAFDAA